MMISMTAPEALRSQCMVDGKRVRLTCMEMRLVGLLLVTMPGKLIPYEDVVEVLWPDADTQPLETKGIISVMSAKLKRKGIFFTRLHGQGVMSFPADRRGGRPVRPYVPTFDDTDADYSWVRLAA